MTVSQWDYLGVDVKYLADENFYAFPRNVLVVHIVDGKPTVFARPDERSLQEVPGIQCQRDSAVEYNSSKHLAVFLLVEKLSVIQSCSGRIIVSFARFRWLTG